ncbi:MAG TPA: serine/threonine-protein kinase [Gemmataceae bacterium]|nr:serine/threonine-protein kinase [Gemmataceae bacterium]
MTTLLPTECRFSPTLLSGTIPSFHQPSAHGRVAVQDTPALPGYKILEVLGRGGMATVYKARQLGTKRLVAVKVIDRSLAVYGEIVARFRQEHALGARLSHPNLTAVYQSGRAAGCPYLVMELVEGDSLDELIGRCGPLPVAEACEVIRQAALGLAHLHEHGIVHRDIKPSNLMLTPAGRVKVLDLGLARHLHEPDAGERITAQGQFLGTLDYVAPEQCTDPHAVDIRADVYGLGCTLYELLAGQAPFARPGYDSAFQKMKAHVEAPVPPIQEPRPDVPEQLASALGRMLAKDREGRFASPAGVVAAVQPFAVGAELAVLAGLPPWSPPE